MLTDVFEEFGDFLFCTGESASAILHENNTYYIYDNIVEIKMVSPMVLQLD